MRSLEPIIAIFIYIKRIEVVKYSIVLEYAVSGNFDSLL